MKNETKYKYGTDTIEFFTFDANELQDRIQMAEEVYYQSVARGEGQLCANIHFHESPFPIALKKLLALHDAGYTVNENKFCGLQGGAIDLTLTKPQSEIDRDLVQVHKRAEEQYHAHRYQLNADETLRQLDISMKLVERDAERARLAAEQKAAEAARQKALAELRAEYHPA